jgi:cellulose synthase/poly-beta-1,6-N-acetylglucosamine synthase-like glycosyltransferase
VKRLSVVIANHNYELYLGEAIDSALALRWGDVEVVVVDDGSTDGSAGLVHSYGDRVRSLLTENAGQREAVNRGFAACTGDVVIFLDADDVLPPDLPAHLAAVWSSSVSKVQFRMQRVDAAGKPLGDPFPTYEPLPTPEQVRHWAASTTAYPTPPGSGNAYARAFLERVLPAGPELGAAADSGPLAAAPFCGDVITVPEVVVGYRQHGANDSDLLSDDTRFAREVARARARWRFAQRVASAPSEAGHGEADESPLFRSRELLQFRVVAGRLTPAQRPLPGDSRVRQLVDALHSPLHPGPERLRVRLVVAFWCLAVLLAPRRAVRPLLRLRWGRQV